MTSRHQLVEEYQVLLVARRIEHWLSPKEWLCTFCSLGQCQLGLKAAGQKLPQVQGYWWGCALHKGRKREWNPAHVPYQALCYPRGYISQKQGCVPGWWVFLQFILRLYTFVALQRPETNIVLSHSDHKTPPANVLLFQRQKNWHLGLCGQSKGSRIFFGWILFLIIRHFPRPQNSLEHRPQKMMEITLPGGEMVFPSAINSCLSYLARIHCSFKTLKRKNLWSAVSDEFSSHGNLLRPCNWGWEYHSSYLTACSGYPR